MEKKVPAGKVIAYVISVLLHAFGIMTLLTIAKIKPLPFLRFYDKLDALGGWSLILKYAILIVIMSISIMTFSTVSGTLKNRRKRKFWTIAITCWSTLITIPLLLSFVALLLTAIFPDPTGGVKAFLDGFNSIMPVTDIHNAFLAVPAFARSIKALQWTYVGGIVLSIIFLAVPITSCVQTVKKAK